MVDRKKTPLLTTTATATEAQAGTATTTATATITTAPATATPSPPGANQPSMPHTTPFVEEFFRVLVPGILDAIVVSVLTRWENKEVWDDKNKSLTHVLVIRNPSRKRAYYRLRLEAPTSNTCFILFMAPFTAPDVW